MSTILAVIALAASKSWDLFQLDVNNAFLHRDLDEKIYMKMPQGIPNPSNKVCKSLYGLKQVSRQWFAKLMNFLNCLGYQQSKNDYSLFIKRNKSDITIVAVYADGHISCRIQSR